MKKKFFKFSCQDTQNDVIGCKNFGKFKLLHLRNHSVDRAKIWCAPKKGSSFDIIFVKIDSWIRIL